LISRRFPRDAIAGRRERRQVKTGNQNAAKAAELHGRSVEARRNLAYTNLPVSTMAYALGFDDPACFSRVYAAATGLSPRAFREPLHGEEA